MVKNYKTREGDFIETKGQKKRQRCNNFEPYTPPAARLVSKAVLSLLRFKYYSKTIRLIKVINSKKEKMKMEELKNIKIIIRWGKNGRKYVWENPTQKKISELIEKYGAEQICGGCLWLWT